MKHIGGPEDHINTRILHSGSKAFDEGYSRDHGLWDPHVYVAVWASKDDLQGRLLLVRLQTQ